MRVASAVELSDGDRSILLRWSRGKRTEMRLVLRVKIVLSAAAGVRNKDIATELGTTPHTVARWRERFVEGGLDAIRCNRPGAGRKPSKRQSLVKKIINTTTQTKPRNATHWSTRTLATELGISRSMVQRVWKAAGLKPHLVKTFKLSNDPKFVEKMTDVVGLYLSPPEKALVLCVDEKSQCQALERTQKSLPMFPGRNGTLTHDYRRHGTTTLFAALNMLDGSIIGECHSKHRHQEYLKFLQMIDRETSSDLDLHLIVDNYATHKHETIKKWLSKHPRFHIHFTPTSSSWLNLVERWFRELTDKCLRRASFTSTDQLTESIMNYIDLTNESPKPFIWTATAEAILKKVTRARAVLDNVQTD